ncbi:hypothetical protein ACS0TY_006176 [Phlomoides rotata]
MSCISEVAPRPSPRGVRIVQHCSVSPPPEGGGEQQLLIPLANFDIVRLRYHLLNFLFFYRVECSESHFVNTIVPNLKNSLSLALKHFLPLAGKMVFPLTPSALLPVCRYVAGDSVSVAIAVSSGADLHHLTGNHSRDADQFHQLLPRVLPHAYCSSDECITFSPLAIQVTLFPNQGISVGHTLNHAVADGATILAFQHAWASINKLNGDAHLGQNIVRLYDRNCIVANKHLASRAWNHMKTSTPTVSLTISLPTNRVRATFSLSAAQIQKLKSVAVKNVAASSLVVLSGYVWSCLAKSAEAVGEEVGDDEAEYLTCTADIRAMLTPPLPHTYFGNCIVLVLAESIHGTLKAENGFVDAAHTIGEAIREIKSKRDNTFDDLEQRLKLKGKGKRVVTIAASPRFDYYGVDYGWGKPVKMEYPTNDCDGSVFVCKPSAGGGIEIGMSLSNLKMDAFATFFHQGITQSSL